MKPPISSASGYLKLITVQDEDEDQDEIISQRQRIDMDEDANQYDAYEMKPINLRSNPISFKHSSHSYTTLQDMDAEEPSRNNSHKSRHHRNYDPDDHDDDDEYDNGIETSNDDQHDYHVLDYIVPKTDDPDTPAFT